MTKYRSKIVEIEAIQWNGDNLQEIIDFTGKHESAKDWIREHSEQIVKEDGLKIFTLEGTMSASIDDYIIKGLKGEFYPCKPDIFQAKYELI